MPEEAIEPGERVEVIRPQDDFFGATGTVKRLSLNRQMYFVELDHLPGKALLFYPRWIRKTNKPKAK